jgi:hypothetical protein
MQPPGRREFLAAAVALAAGPVRAGLIDRLIAKRYGMVDDDVARYRGPVEGNGFLDQPAFSMDDCRRLPQVPYRPQPGDVMLSQTRGKLYTAGHWIAGAVQPSHSGFVCRKADGTIVIMEAGSFDVAVIRSLPVTEHLSAYHNRKHVWIRPRCVPLTPEQECRLTEFAERQEGKRFARFRVYAQVTPFRSRGKLRTGLLGGPHGPDRRSYFCAEMVTEAFVYAGLIPAENTRPAATYPCDLFFDESKIPFLNRNFKLGRFGWGIPCRWRPLPV